VSNDHNDPRRDFGRGPVCRRRRRRPRHAARLRRRQGDQEIKVIKKYESSSCDEIKALKGEPPSEKEKMAIDFLRNDAGAQSLHRQDRRAGLEQDVRMRADPLIGDGLPAARRLPLRLARFRHVGSATQRNESLGHERRGAASVHGGIRGSDGSRAFDSARTHQGNRLKISAMAEG
jgi:hypothetical protein